MTPRLRRGALLLAVLAGCTEGTRERVTPASLTILPDTAWLLVGAARQLDARLADSAGGTLDDRHYQWEALTPGVVAVSAGGQLTGVAAGRAQVRASWQALADTLALDVDGPSGPMPAGDFRCGDWLAGAPAPARLLVDVSLPDTGVPARLEALGARVLHAFHLPFLRVLLDRDSIPALGARYANVWVTTVVDTADTRKILLLTYDRAVSAADTSELRAMGAEPRFIFGDVLSATAADELVPALIALPSVTGYEPDGPACPAPASAGRAGGA